jgi:adenosine deaminase
MTILLCTLGTTWQVIPEALGLVDPGRCPLYAAAPARAADLRTARHLSAPTELWVVSTAGTRGEAELREWWTRLNHPGRLRLWRTAASDGAAQAEVELIRELIHRAVLHAGPETVLCLSGGRKTMSADMQRAGMTYGCRGMLHVLPPEGDLFEQLNEHDFTQPLPAELATLMQPVLVGSSHRADLVDLPPALDPGRYPLPIDGQPFVADGTWLSRDLAQREQEGTNLLVQFHAEVARDERHENWRCLYRLPPARIEALRRCTIGPADHDWLRRLPKAELHCHLGGILDLDEQIAVGQALWAEVPPARREAARAFATPWLHTRSADFSPLPRGLARAEAAAALLAETDPAVLAATLWPPAEDRFALKHRHPEGFKAYERPGCLVGSTILQHPAAIAATARAVRARCRRDGLAYLELRCSPQKYRRDFVNILQAELAACRQPDDADIRLVIIADRRDDDVIPAVVQLALDAAARWPGLVVGIDLAGDEQRGDPSELAPLFTAAFAHCLRVTIHAGEGEPADRIWQAAYHLHADRIGHGLTLVDRPDLAARFRDRRICLELCPTSNHEVVGFGRDGLPPYPLRALIDLGVPLTLCTDNPGISRTTLAREYLLAGRLAGLTRWEALALIKQGFLHAFLPAADREALLKSIDHRIATIIADEDPCPAP